MRSSPLFAGLPERVCAEIASCALVRRFQRDEVLFSQGDPGISLALLRAGCVKQTQVSVDGHEALIRFSRKGEALNIQAESRLCGHTCSARAVEPSTILVWDHRHIDNFVARYTQLADNIMRILAGQLQELEERFREMATEDAETRVRLVLARLVHQIGKPAANGTRIVINRNELAQMTGTTMFSVSRFLSVWSGQGLVVPLRESVIVCDPKRLALSFGQLGS